MLQASSQWSNDGGGESPKNRGAPMRSRLGTPGGVCGEIGGGGFQESANSEGESLY